MQTPQIKLILKVVANKVKIKTYPPAALRFLDDMQIDTAEMNEVKS
jgi:hypothetical protein